MILDMVRRYHHGELRAAMIRGSLELIAEQGMQRFSVAQVARRVGVSTAAPYRHFADREGLLAAVARTVAEELADQVRAAAEEHTDPADRLAAAAGGYTRHTIESRAGLPVVFASELHNSQREDLHESKRTLMDGFLELALAAAPDPPTALELMEQLLAQAHGYATLHLDGVFGQHGYDVDLVVRKSVDAARIVIAGRCGAAD
ncbi:TetR/AcrR family transcriptional regulator [Saccharopolyspora sp. CA-218241]|uniref:TetR/AcrR family transcriptional regulator n=1 Tax=Saccharopolyspora sp. CA-218241 TaxID=3240027 RepID=UPI003D97D719